MAAAAGASSPEGAAPPPPPAAAAAGSASAAAPPMASSDAAAQPAPPSPPAPPTYDGEADGSARPPSDAPPPLPTASGGDGGAAASAPQPAPPVPARARRRSTASKGRVPVDAPARLPATASYSTAETDAARELGLFRDAPRRSCSMCDSRTKGARLRCTRCRKAWYCSAKCQKADWKTHKVDCTAPNRDGVPATLTTAKVKPEYDDFAVSATDIGAGNFSRVARATHRITREVFALKLIEKAKVGRMAKRHKNIHNEIFMEKNVLARLRHPLIIRLYFTFQDAVALYYLMEYVEGGELWDRLMDADKKHQVGCGETLTKFYCRQIVEAVEYLHVNGVAHRDLKPENIMVVPATGAIKVVDFGTAKDLVNTERNGPSFVGTPDYIPPELVNSKEGGKGHDLWALGVMIYQMISGRTPFKAASAYLTFQRVQAMDLQFPTSFPADARDLVSKLLVEDADARLGAGADEDGNGFAALKAHPFFEGCGWPGRVPVRPLRELAMAAAAETIATLPAPSDEAELDAIDGPISPPVAESGAAAAATPASGSARAIRTGLDPAAMHSAITELLTEAERNALMHQVALRRGLGSQHVYSLFFRDRSDARYLRAGAGLGFGRGGRGFLGLEQEEEGQWKDSLAMVVVHDPRVGALGSPSSLALQATVARVREMTPVPRCLIIVGDVTATAAADDRARFDAEVAEAKRVLAGVAEDIALVFVPGANTVATHDDSGGGVDTAVHESLFGDAFFGFWCGGVRGLIVCSELSDVAARVKARDGKAHNPVETQALAQQAWLTRELESCKFGAQHMCVFSQRPWVDPRAVRAAVGDGTAAPAEAPPTLTDFDRRVGVPMLLHMRHNNARAVFTGASGAAGNWMALLGKVSEKAWRSSFGFAKAGSDSDSSSDDDSEGDGGGDGTEGAGTGGDDAAASDGGKGTTGGDAAVAAVAGAGTRDAAASAGAGTDMGAGVATGATSADVSAGTKAPSKKRKMVKYKPSDESDKTDTIQNSTQVVQTQALLPGGAMAGGVDVEAVAGVRVLSAFMNRLEHEFYVLSEVPKEIDLYDEDQPVNPPTDPAMGDPGGW